MSDDARAGRLKAEITRLNDEQKSLMKGIRFFTMVGVVIALASPVGLAVDGWLTFGAALTGIFFMAVSQYLGHIYIRDAREKKRKLEKQLESLKPAPAPGPAVPASSLPN